MVKKGTKSKKSKPRSKARRKKKEGVLHYIWLGVKYFFLGVGLACYYLFKGALLAVNWVIDKFKKKSSESTMKKIEKNRPKSNAEYSEFKIVESIDGDFKDFEKKMLQGKSTIGIILGARGTGKSAVGVKILENIKAKTHKKIYALGFDRSTMPKWITVVDNIESVANNSVLLADEGGIQFSSRDSMSDVNKFLSQLLFVARHKDMSILFISQNSSNIEINTLRQADYLILKRSSLLQGDFERKKIKEIYEGVKGSFKKYKSDKGITYIYSDNYRGFVSTPLPSFWNQDISKSYKGFSKKK